MRTLALRVLGSVALSLASFAPARVAAQPVSVAAGIGGPDFAFDRDDCCAWQSLIRPLPAGAAQAATTDYLANGLMASGFVPPDWRVEYRPLAGGLSILAYYAWVTNYPAVNCGGLVAPDPSPGTRRRGGAVLCLQYNPGAGDPAAGDVHWVQGVTTDYDPRPTIGASAPVFQGPGGSFQFVDNGGSTVSPYYDLNGGLANGSFFLDIPFQVCPDSCIVNRNATFSVFLATDETAADGTEVIALYSAGVTWGYNFFCSPSIASTTPEPGTLALVGCGCLCSLAVVRERRSSGARSRAPSTADAGGRPARRARVMR